MLLSAAPIFNVLQFNPVRWFDAMNPNGNADSSWPTSGSSITTWVDKSKSLVDATQSTGANKPIFQASYLNGKPSIVFDGNAQYLLNGTGNAITGNEVTLFVAAYPTNISTPNTIRPCMYSTRRSGDAGGWQFEIGDELASDQAAGVATPNNFLAITAINTVTTNPILLTYHRTAAKVNSIFINGISKPLTIATNIDFITNASTKLIGQGSNLASLHYWEGGISELILINAALSMSDVSIIHRYLSNKWGVAV